MQRLEIDHLEATGTRDATTFLRGDHTWAVPSLPGAEVLLLPAGSTSSSVPVGTPVGTIILVKA